MLLPRGRRLPTRRHRRVRLICALATAIIASGAVIKGQVPAQPPLGSLAPPPPAPPDRATVLQAEADRLAKESRTLLGELRKLEVERELHNERARRADAAVAEANSALAVTNRRLATLEQTRLNQLPDLRLRLVDLYKRGRTGNLRLLLGATGVRDFARTARAVSSMSRVTQAQLDEHQKLLTAARAERATQVALLARLQAEQRRATEGRVAANSAVAARAALLSDIDQKRDLTAQLAGELQVASRRLDEQVTSLAAAPATAPPAVVPAPPAVPAAPPVAPPIPATAGRPPSAGTAPVPRMPVRGGIEWPLAGPVVGRFGETVTRFGASTVRNGIEIEADEAAPVRAVHDGTVIFAAPFAGFGTLVVLDHGRGYHTVYGYLSAASVNRGDRLETGHELGRVGMAPGGSAALYFEFRLDGRSVDPLQWLRPR